MQKHFVREHGERGVKASNWCVALREKRNIAKYMVAVKVLLNVINRKGELAEKSL